MNNLGFIPAWQFNMDPAMNPQVTDMRFPPGMTQSTAQPVGPYLGGTMDAPIDAANAMFDSWWWKNRKWIVVGTVAALGLGVLGGLAAILK
jgi:hypothetical protein